MLYIYVDYDILSIKFGTP